MVKGKVVDSANQIVEGATVILETKDSGARRFKVTTNKKGEYIQIGLQPGSWTITASKDGVGEAKADVRITLGASEQIDLTLGKAGAAGGPAMSKEEAAKLDTMQKAFDEGVKLTQAGKLDEAIAKFMEAKAVNPDCFACQFNIGLSYAAKKDVPKAEEAFLAASALKPESPEPFNQMANMYNANKQYDKAAQMAAEASKRSGGATGGGASAESLFNQGVVLWNGAEVRRGQGAVRGGGEGQAGLRRRALLGRDGEPQHRRDAGRARLVRELSEVRAHRAVRRAGEDVPGSAAEVTLT